MTDKIETKVARPRGYGEMTLAQLKRQARALDIRQYSRMRKQQLIDSILLKTVTVYRGDRNVTQKLGSKYLRTVPVFDWAVNLPLSWSVPRSVLDAHQLVPLSQEEVEDQKKARYEEKYGKQRYEHDEYSRPDEDKICKIASKIGAEADGALAEGVLEGRVDPVFAELIAFKAMYRHNFTDYDELLRSGHDRDSARAKRTDKAIPSIWSEYLKTYEFRSPEALALASVFQDPTKCHPIWFKEAEIAVRVVGLDLSTLTYEKIRDAITLWREQRRQK